jgi:hypothetical protein
MATPMHAPRGPTLVTTAAKPTTQPRTHTDATHLFILLLVIILILLPGRQLSQGWQSFNGSSTTPRPLFDTSFTGAGGTPVLHRANSTSVAVGSEAGITMLTQQNKALQVPPPWSLTLAHSATSASYTPFSGKCELTSESMLSRVC